MSTGMGMIMGNGNDIDMGIYTNTDTDTWVSTATGMNMGTWTRALATMIIDNGIRAGPRATDRVYGNNADRVSSRV